MKWFVAALLFALAVMLTIGTAAIRAENVLARRRIEQRYRLVQDRIVELRRLSMERLAAASPQRLAQIQWRFLADEAGARQRRQQ